MVFFRRCLAMMRIIPGLLFLLSISGTASAQQLIWEVEEQLSDGVDYPEAIVLTKAGVMVAGQAKGEGEGFEFVVQTLGRATGKVKSTVGNFVSYNCPLRYVRCYNRRLVAHVSPNFYMVTFDVSPDGNQTDIAVTAFDENSAAIKWMSYWNADNRYPAAIAASRQAVIVSSEGGALRAYDAVSGTMLWEDQLDARLGYGVTVAIAGNRAFAAAATPNSELQVRSYNARSGRLRWEVRRPFPVRPVKLLVNGADLFVAGSSDVFIAGNLTWSGTERLPYLARLEAGTGLTVWENTTDVVETSGGHLSELAVDGDRIVAAGGVVMGPTVSGFVRSYQVSDGQVNWTTARLWGGYDEPTAIAVHGNRVYGVGARGELGGLAEVLLRAYDAGTGAIVWEDFSHRAAPSIIGPSHAIDLAVGEHRLFVAGFVPNHFLIRAYDISGDW
ncbi:MAG: PQQ-binding-like beta-propeller repeat protein [Acidobacteriota bacterium]